MREYLIQYIEHRLLRIARYDILLNRPVEFELRKVNFLQEVREFCIQRIISRPTAVVVRYLYFLSSRKVAAELCVQAVQAHRAQQGMD